MIDGASAVDPLVAEGPMAPVEMLRPLPNLQRLLLLDEVEPMMADLATGDIRQWENGPPVSVPMMSAPFSIDSVERLQVQILRDPRPSSVDNTLFSLAFGTTTVDVVESRTKQLVIRYGQTDHAAGPIGESLAIVIVITHNVAESLLTIHARNAENLTGIEASIDMPNTESAVLTVGGPSAKVRGIYGRRRLSPVLLDIARPVAPVDHLRRAASKARRVAGALKDRGR